jgi:hypothetical protein
MLTIIMHINEEKIVTQKKPTNFHVVGIGIAIGILMTYLGFIVINLIDGSFNWQDLYIEISAVIQGGIVFVSPWGIAGAIIGRNWKNNISATWVGAIAGIIIGLGSVYFATNFSLYSNSKRYFNAITLFIFLLPGLPFGIMGAMIGRGWKKSNRAMWIGCILGAIVGIVLFGWLYVWASWGFSTT